MFEIVFYRDAKGTEPVKEYIISLVQEAKTNKSSRIKANKIHEYMQVLQEHGTRAGLPYIKHLIGDIWELRPLQDRILFFYYKDNTFVLLHHFHKKTQKTPPQELEQAQRKLKDYLARG